MDTSKSVLARCSEIDKDITIKDYELFEKGKNKNAITEMIFCRLNGRYLRPFLFENKEYKKIIKMGLRLWQIVVCS